MKYVTTFVRCVRVMLGCRDFNLTSSHMSIGTQIFYSFTSYDGKGEQVTFEHAVDFVAKTVFETHSRRFNLAPAISLTFKQRVQLCKELLKGKDTLDVPDAPYRIRATSKPTEFEPVTMSLWTNIVDSNVSVEQLRVERGRKYEPKKNMHQIAFVVDKDFCATYLDGTQQKFTRIAKPQNKKHDRYAMVGFC